MSFCFFAFRVCVRLRTFHRLFIDDAFVLLAWLLLVTYAALWQWMESSLYLSIAVASGQVPLQRLPPNFTTEAEKFLHATFVSYSFFYTSLWSVKVSFLLFFRKFGNHIRSQRIIWWCVAAFTMASYFVCFGLMSTKCLIGPGGSNELGRNREGYYSVPFLIRLSYLFQPTHSTF